MATRRTALLELLKRQRMAVQASTSANGAPQAALVAIVVGDGLELLFDTIRTSRKAENLRQNPRVAFVIGGWTPGDKGSVQYEGIAEELGGADIECLRKLGSLIWPGDSRKHRTPENPNGCARNSPD
jgi:general stress protein 26